MTGELDPVAVFIGFLAFVVAGWAVCAAINWIRENLNG